MYLRVHMCIMNVHVHVMCICSFMFSLYLLVLIITTAYCLYTVLRFNKADLIYLQSLPVEGIPCGTLSYSSSHELLYGLLMGLQIDICVSIYILRDNFCV